jgi:adenylate cyclase
MPDATALRETAEALAIAERSGDDLALELSRSARAIALMHQDGPEHDAGVALLEKVREDIHRERFSHAMSGVIDMHIAKEKARSGDLDGAIELSGTIVDDRVDSGEVGWTVLATVVLVEALLRRRAEGDLQQAQAAIDRLADVPTEPGMVMLELSPLRSRALLAQAHGDEAAYRDYRDRYRAMATSLGFEGHMKWAEEMP